MAALRTASKVQPPAVAFEAFDATGAARLRINVDTMPDFAHRFFSKIEWSQRSGF